MNDVEMNVRDDEGGYESRDAGSMVDLAALRACLSQVPLAPADDARIANPDMHDGREPKPAAVLIPVLTYGSEPRILLTHRTSHLAAHAGQVAFPGGKIDAGDRDATHAALREAEEEVGLGRHLVDIAGYSDDYISTTGFRITPVLGFVSQKPDLILNEGEVASVFEVPLAFLMNDVNHRIEQKIFKGRARSYYVMPYQEHYIWGVTAAIIRRLYMRLHGLQGANNV